MPKPPQPPKLFRSRIPARRLLLITLLLALLAVPMSAQRPAQASAPANFDIRIDRDTIADAYMDRFGARADGPIGTALARVRAAGLQRLRGALNAEVIESPELGSPEVVSMRPGSPFLSGPSTDRVGTMRAFLTNYADAFGLSAGVVGGLVPVADYENPGGNMAWVELEQRINGLPVFRGLIRGGFSARGELARITGPLATGVDAAALPVLPSLTARQAIVRAAANVGWNVEEEALLIKSNEDGKSIFTRASMAGEPRAWLLYFPLAPGIVRLAWAVEIVGDPDGFLIVLDAQDGTVLFRKNLTEYQTQPATYVVYTDDSPAPLSPTTVAQGAGTQAPYVSRVSRTLVGNESPNTFNNLGWMTDATNVTDGNNVEAGPDRVSPDGVDAPVTGVSRVFDFAYDPQTDAPTSTEYQGGEVTDMFYWTNLYHDRLYLLGFTEAARNFQNDNFGRGGAGNDRVRAEAQDSTDVNNANFQTQADGIRGRMQMYIFPGPNPDRSSGIDHDVLLHELTHGTSNRLHNNASGLTSTMARGMGEGWSDFYARALLSTADEDPNAVYTTGGWVTYQLIAGYTDNYYYGIRRFPYAVKTTVGTNGKPHNPLTFADVDSGQLNLTDGASPRNPSSFISSSATEVHNLGEIWCMALLEVRARFINRLGWAVGNQRILQYVTDGMKLDPVNPTFLQARDSILTAAAAGGATQGDINDIWAGFAVRGMGASAQMLSTSSLFVLEAFDAPGLSPGTYTLLSESIPNGSLDPSEVVTVGLCIANTSAVASSAVTGTLLAGGGVTSPSIPQSYGTVPPASNTCRNFTFTVAAACGGFVNATLRAAENGSSPRDLVFSLPVGTVTPLFTQNFDTVSAPNLPAGWTTSTLSGAANPWVTNTTTPDTPPNRLFALDLITSSDSVVISPSIVLPPQPTRLSFRHAYNTELSFDGGVLEISIAGAAFQDILVPNGTFLSGGYARTLSTGTSISGRKGWSGNSQGYVTSLVDMPAAAAGQSVQLRWRMASDSTVGGSGWAVDTVSIGSSVCGAPPAKRRTGQITSAGLFQEAPPPQSFADFLTRR